MQHALLVALLLLAISGCSSVGTSTNDSGSKPAEVTTGTPASDKTPASTKPHPGTQTEAAYRALLNKADIATGQGDYKQALALLERALRIAPHSAEIYLNLARTYKAKGDLSQSSATAERGMLYCESSRECSELRSFVR